MWQATRLVARRGEDDEAYAWPYVRMPGCGGRDWINDRAHAEVRSVGRVERTRGAAPRTAANPRAPRATQAFYAAHEPETHAFRQRLYAREAAVAYRRGTVLLYRYDTWHRGTPLRAGAPVRRVLNLAIARESARWITPWNCEVRLAPKVTAADATAAAGFAKRMYFGHAELLANATVEQRTALGVPPPRDRYWTTRCARRSPSAFPRGTCGRTSSDRAATGMCMCVRGVVVVRVRAR